MRMAIPQQEQEFRTLTLRPDPLQFLINDLPWIVVCVAGLLYGWMHVSTFGTWILGISAVMMLRLLYRYLLMRRCRFILTSEVLVYDRGVFSRDADFIELYRIVDYREKHSFMQQLFGLKTIVIYSGDRTTPQLFIPGVSRDADIIPVIRERVEYNKRKKGVYEITNR